MNLLEYDFLSDSTQDLALNKLRYIMFSYLNCGYLTYEYSVVELVQLWPAPAPGLATGSGSRLRLRGKKFATQIKRKKFSFEK